MCNPYRSGTADWWYSGFVADMWVEYKFLSRPPVRAPAKADLTALQMLWLRNRYKEGRKVFVVIGCPKGGVILKDLAWENLITPKTFLESLKDRQAIARWIQEVVNGRATDGISAEADACDSNTEPHNLRHRGINHGRSRAVQSVQKT
jgi:hypothetical protein